LISHQKPKTSPALGTRKPKAETSLSAAGLFAGIGGLDIGFRDAGFEEVLLCESDPAAGRVLKSHFPHAKFEADVRRIKRLPHVDVLTAGFPCQDLSQVGSRKGIDGPNSGLIRIVMDLLAVSKSPRWLVLENVPFMLRLHRGRAMTRIVHELERMGWSWAYRTIDSRAFGLPQRRRRVILLASREHDPSAVLHSNDEGEPEAPLASGKACGFYWTEGNTGIGWAENAIPPLKGGSGIHIPSPPGIWFPKERFIGTPTLRDAERLQGFAPDWTAPADAEPNGSRRRWRLGGNAVSAPLSCWLAERILDESTQLRPAGMRLLKDDPWPTAARGGTGVPRERVHITEWPVRMDHIDLADFLNDAAKPLSYKAANGFWNRLGKSSLKREKQFERDLVAYVSKRKKLEGR
jgi:DNA (cytosine-5)-methyltransferase 1